MKKILIYPVAFLFLFSFGIFTNAYATNITIADLVSSGIGWSGAQEDQEVEPNCVATQAWDLEAFVVNGTTLTMIGGYNFKDGESTWKSGDIFFATSGMPSYGPANVKTGSGNSTVPNTYGYDYAVRLDFGTTNKLQVYGLTSGSTVKTTTVYYAQNDESNPWRYLDGGNALTGFNAFNYQTGLTDAQVLAQWGVSLEGGSHNAVTFDVSFLNSSDYWVHFTQQCGNDNLMGHQVPEPGTLLFLGAGLLGLGFAIRRRKK